MDCKWKLRRWFSFRPVDMEIKICEYNSTRFTSCWKQLRRTLFRKSMPPWLMHNSEDLWNNLQRSQNAYQVRCLKSLECEFLSSFAFHCEMMKIDFNSFFGFSSQMLTLWDYNIRDTVQMNYSLRWKRNNPYQNACHVHVLRKSYVRA